MSKLAALVLAGAALAAPLAAQSASTAAPAGAHVSTLHAMIPDGTYSSTITRADAPTTMSAGLADSLAGTWTLVMTGPRYSARYNGAEVVTGEYHSIPNDQIHFPDTDAGSMACHVDGVYHVVVADHQITYHKVRDECTGRVVVLTSHPFVMKS